MDVYDTARRQSLAVRQYPAMRDELARDTGRLDLQILADRGLRPPDPRLIAKLGAQRCLSLGLVPLARYGAQTLVAISRPADWPRIEPEISAALGPVTPAEGQAQDIDGLWQQHFRSELTARAETRVPADRSIRTWPDILRSPALRAMIAIVGVGLLIWPAAMLMAILCWTLSALTMSSFLRATALWIAYRHRNVPAKRDPDCLHLPMVSVLVPLFREKDIAPRLIERLGKLDYPRDKLEIVLILEERDTETRLALTSRELPSWMRIIVVPEAAITTKPRAMNYALDFCRGAIIGIYDAEDAPDPDQLRKVAARFAARGADVACLQGALDYYNPRTNVVARLFTAEYAAWFRVVMPALQRLGLPMPLGGTTLFLRREALERVGAWDAHNVTEDADLGVRLARNGLRTEMLDTTTEEEANCRPRYWVRQRSRWIKGHLLTWAIHMHRPQHLLRDLGWRGFLGYQLVFIGAQSQVLMAPLLWSFWLHFLGFYHPASAHIGPQVLNAVLVLFALSELLVFATCLVGLGRTRHRGLWRAVPLLPVYHAFAAMAGWRAAWESLRNPFYWAKTSHGHYGPTDDPPPLPS